MMLHQDVGAAEGVAVGVAFGGGKNLAGIIRKISHAAREKSIRLGGIDELSYSDFINGDDCND